MTIHFPSLHLGLASDAAYYHHRKRNGDVQVVRVYEHTRKADTIPKGWRGPFASVLDAARDADRSAHD